MTTVAMVRYLATFGNYDLVLDYRGSFLAWDEDDGRKHGLETRHDSLRF